MSILTKKMSDSKSLTTKEVARLCKVSDATVKRWEEAGLLRSERTNGGHRRFRADEIARFQRESGLGLKQQHGETSVIGSVTHRRRTKKSHSTSSLYHSLVAGREDESANILINACLRGAPLTQVFDEMITEAMKRIGDLWCAGELTIAQEHLATRTLITAVQKLRGTVPVPEPIGMLAMCCGFEADYHELAAQLAQMTLESIGWEVLNFGPNTPLYALVDEVLQHSPEIVCISSSVMNDIERTARDYKEFRAKIERLNVSVVLGGRVFEDERIRRRFPCELFAKSFSDVLEFAGKLTALTNAELERTAKI